MDKMEFDRTRKAIGSEKLADKEKEAMLKKLQGAGGQVMKEKSDREKREQALKNQEKNLKQKSYNENLPSNVSKDRNRQVVDIKLQQKRLRDEEEREAKSFLSIFFLKLKCKMQGVTAFSKPMVTPRFMSVLNLDLKRALMECNILGNDLFMSNPETGKKIMKELDSRGPIYVELIDRAAALYDRKELSDLVSPYNINPEMSVPIDAITAPLFSTLRKLYYFHSFKETYMVAVNMAIDTQESIEKKQSNLYVLKKKKIRSDWNTLMYEVYPSLILLAQRAEGMRAEPGGLLFEEMIGVSAEEKIGQRKLGDNIGIKTDKKEEPKAEAAEEEEEKVEEEKKEEPVNEFLENGYRLMRMINIINYRKEADKRNELDSLDIRDKVLLSYLLCKVFNDEYSFVLTTAKIKINAMYREGTKLDYREKMSDSAMLSQPVEDSMKRYLQEAGELKKAIGDQPLSRNYVEHAKRVESIENKRGAAGRQVRVQIKDYMNRVSDILKVLVEDINSGSKIVDNKDDILKFDLASEQKRRLNGKSVTECIKDAYSFSLALADRIENRDLFGGVIELPEEDFRAGFFNSGADTGSDL